MKKIGAAKLALTMATRTNRTNNVNRSSRMDNRKVANYLKSAMHGLRLKISKEYNPMIKQLLETDEKELQDHIRELEKAPESPAPSKK